jgi:PAS domain S-box-containing protein
MSDSPLIELNDCPLAFDLDEQKFLFISPGITGLTGYSAADFYQNTNLLNEIIDPHYRDSVKTQNGKLAQSGSIELYYRIVTAGGDVKSVHEKRSLIADQHTGHKIILSIIRYHPPEKIRQQEDAKLREKFLNSLIDSQTNFLVRFDPTGEFTFANKQFLKVLGYKKTDIIGKHYSFVTVPEENEICEKALYNCIHHPGKIIHLAHKKIAKDGTLFDTDWEFIAITNEQGKVIEIQGIGHDITQKISIENEIKRTSAKLDAFIDSINDYFFILDTDWKFVRVNSAFEKVSCKDHNELVGFVIWDVFPQLIGTAFEKMYKKAFAENITVQFTEYIDYANMWFDASVYPSSEGLTVFIKDITIEKRAQEEAIWTKNNLEALINNTEDQIWSLDKESRYVYMNRAYRNQIARLTGAEPKEGDYSYLHQGYSEDVIEQWNQFYGRALAGERYSIVNESIDPITRQVLCFEISFNPIYKVKGDITGVGCFARNITERLEIEKAIISQNERLRHIASLTSHELRRPVASMLGLINIMDRRNFYNPDNKEVIEHLLTVGNEIDEVIRLIIDKTFLDDTSKNKYQSP